MTGIGAMTREVKKYWYLELEIPLPDFLVIHY